MKLALRRKIIFTGNKIFWTNDKLSSILPRCRITDIYERQNKMAQAQKGNMITINYTGTLADGTVFDSTLEGIECEEEECCDDDCSDDGCGCGHESGPMTFILGEAILFPKIDEEIVGMTPGEKKIIHIPAPEAFGEYDKEKVFTVPRADLPEDLVPEVGDELVLSNEDDEELGVTVLETTEESVTFDSNHPLAGEDLTFEVELVSIDKG
jgi:peptidylprolyl isomerase